MMLAHLRRMARYNAWANARLMAACGSLDEDAYLAPRPAFFGSIHNTLSHVYVTDVIWLERIEGRPPSLWTLDHVPYAGREDLFTARSEMDGVLTDAIDASDEAALEGEALYRTATVPQTEQRTPRADCWLHLFNHQTHHRGQVHGLLSATDVAPPSLDLISYLRQTHART